MNNKFCDVCITALIICLATGPIPALAQGEQSNNPPVISHEPVTKAVKGQALTVKAKVTDDRGAVESVTLYYTLSRDAAPFKLTMQSAGLDLYVGTVESGVMSGVDSMSYYIEAQDDWGATRETPWYAISLREPKPEPIRPAANPGADAGKKVTPTKGGEEEGSHIPKGIIAGGAAALIAGGIVLASQDSGGGGGGGGGGNATTNQGTYAGTSTSCLTFSGSTPTCETRSATVQIDSTGVVVSDSLQPGQTLTGRLDGNTFTLSGTTEDAATGLTGEINYNGTVVGGNRIVGNISGNASTPTASGTYSGSFTLIKQ